MPLTVEEIAQNVGVMIGKPITPIYAARLINEAIRKLVIMYPKTTAAHASYSVSVDSANLSAPLPNNCIEIMSVLKDGIKTSNYTAEYGLIHFKDIGVYDISIIVPPGQVTNPSDEPGVHELYQACLASYVGGTVLLAEDNQSPMGMALMGEYVAISEKTHNQLRMPKRKDICIKPRLWR